MIEHRIVTDPEEALKLAEEWEALRRPSADPDIESHHGWLRAHRSRSQSFLVAAVYEAGRLIGAAPFIVRSTPWECKLGYRPIVRFKMRIARLCGNTFLDSGDSAVLDELVKAVGELRTGPDAFIIESLDAGSEQHAKLTSSAAIQQRYWIYYPTRQGTRWWADLPSTFNEYLGNLKRHDRKELKRYVRLLENKLGASVELDIVADEAGIPTLLKEVERLSAMSWQGRTLGRVIRADPGPSSAYSALARLGMFRAYVLRSGNRGIAFLIGIQSNGVYYPVATGYDPELASCSPGRVLFSQAIQDLIESGDRSTKLDMGFGDNFYKQFFCNRAVPVRQTMLIRKSMRNGFALIMHRLLRTLTDLGRSTFARLGMVAKVRHRLRGRPRQS